MICRSVPHRLKYKTIWKREARAGIGFYISNQEAAVRITTIPGDLFPEVGKPTHIIVDFGGS